MLPLVALAAVQAGTSLLSGYMQSKYIRFQGDLQAQSALMQGDAEAFAYTQNANAALRDKEKMNEHMQQQLYSFDLGIANQLADLKYEYAKAGIPMNGSALTNVQANMTQAGLQRSLIISAGNEEGLNMQLAAINGQYMASMALSNARYSARAAKYSSRAQSTLTQQQAVLGAAGNSLGILSRGS